MWRWLLCKQDYLNCPVVVTVTYNVFVRWQKYRKCHFETKISLSSIALCQLLHFDLPLLSFSDLVSCLVSLLHPL